MSCWVKVIDSLTSPFPFCGYGYHSNYNNFYLSFGEGGNGSNNTFGVDCNSLGFKTSTRYDFRNWHFVAIVISDGIMYSFVNRDKEILGGISSLYTIQYRKFQIGRWCDHTNFSGKMNIFGVRLYNRALTDEEIEALSREYVI